VRRVTSNRSSGAKVGIPGMVGALGIESLAVAIGTVKLAALDEPVKDGLPVANGKNNAKALPRRSDPRIRGLYVLILGGDLSDDFEALGSGNSMPTCFR
jgi:hypothetical protein